VHLFQGELSMADMTVLETAGAHWQRAHRGKRVELVIVLPSGARMSADERDRMTQLMRRGEKDRIASATVILADGLRGALHRSLLTGLTLLAPAPHPMKVFSRLEDALAFLTPYLQKLPDVVGRLDEPLAAVTALYEAFQRRR
jgi:hypothetical protein